MTFAKMKNEILFNTSSQCAHMSINPDKGKIYIYVKFHIFVCICIYV